MKIIPALLPASQIGCNFNPLRSGYRALAIVVHVTAAKTAESTLGWFKDRRCTASAHYLVDKDGSRVWNLVRERDTAWHGGTTHEQRLATLATHPGFTWINPGVSTNAVTIGIEHVGLEHDTWADALYAASAELIAGIADRWSIPLDRNHIVGHRDIFPPHPGCPGTCDLDRLIALAKTFPQKSAS